MNITRITTRAQTEAIYIEVENGNASDPLVAGDVVEFELAATAVYPGKSVVDGTVDDPLVAGVVRGKSIGNTANIPANEFGKVQVYGFCDLVTTDGSVDAGETLVAAASAVAKGTATALVGVFGVALAADTSTTLTAAFIKAMGV